MERRFQVSCAKGYKLKLKVHLELNGTFFMKFINVMDLPRILFPYYFILLMFEDGIFFI